MTPTALLFLKDDKINLMKIGIYCTSNYPYPVPDGIIYANMTVAGTLADNLADLGEDVTFFAPTGTKTRAKLVTFETLPFSHPEVSSKYPHPNSSFDYQNIFTTKVLNYCRDNKFDVLNTHCQPFSILNMALLTPALQVAITVHDPISDNAYNLLPVYAQFPNIHLISLSLAQRKPQPNAPWAANVYNGIDVNRFPANSTLQHLSMDSYLLYVGRVMAEKGADLAVQIALRAGIPLKIAGSVYPKDREFFEANIKPYLDVGAGFSGPSDGRENRAPTNSTRITYLGSLSREDIIPLYQNALALLMPIRWEEPFGLVAIESLACGTPVIAASHGSVPEILKDGETGFIVPDAENTKAFVDAVNKINIISREDCREYIKEKFSSELMAKNYLLAYRKLLN